ncbi:hypothetical protein IVB38_06445 [Bradyrhizobium sp. 38]|nr:MULTISPECIES: hypothetical protein [unclassified Bradyrhizobium]MCK1335680.1 hypothetical protein [Bradyrhizobium sp. 38]MCK1782676.1 hypothetical protein [Bradyrhizobium sp. 132]
MGNHPSEHRDVALFTVATTFLDIAAPRAATSASFSQSAASLNKASLSAI